MESIETEAVLNAEVVTLSRMAYRVSTEIGGKENLKIVYLKNCEKEDLLEQLKKSREKDLKLKTTSVGPHRDDLGFFFDDIDVRKFGSQGQQRCAALSLKLSEIELVKSTTGDTPILLLDDVLSELDSNRQNFLLNSIHDIHHKADGLRHHIL